MNSVSRDLRSTACAATLKSAATKRRPVRNAAKFVEAALLAVLPVGVPPSFRCVAWARFEGAGRKRHAIAGLVMFDGRGATVEVHNRPPCVMHRWTHLPGGNVYWTGEAWARDIQPDSAPAGAQRSELSTLPGITSKDPHP